MKRSMDNDVLTCIFFLEIAAELLLIVQRDDSAHKTLLKALKTDEYF